MSSESKQFFIHGYCVQRGDDRFVGVCLRPFLVVEGDSHGQVKTRLLQLIRAYLEDAVQEGEVERRLQLRAPLKYYFEYCLGTLVIWLKRLPLNWLASSYRTFSKPLPLPQHG